MPEEIKDDMETTASKVRRKLIREEKKFKQMNTVVKVWEVVENGKKIKKIQKANGSVYSMYLGKA